MDDEVDGVTGADSINLSDTTAGGGVEALDSEGEVGAETPNSASFFLCSDFCFLSSRSASISALLCSLAWRSPDLVEAPAGRDENHDIRPL